MVNSSSFETSGLSNKVVVKEPEFLEAIPKSVGLSLSIAAKIDSQPIAKRFSIPALGQEIQKIINKKFDSKQIDQHSLLQLPEQGGEKSCFTKMSDEEALSLFTLIAAKSLIQAYPAEPKPLKHLKALLREMLQGGALQLLPKDLGALANLLEYPLSLLEVPSPEGRLAKVLADLQSLPEGEKLAVMGHGTLIYRFCKNEKGGFDLKIYTSSKKSSAVIGEGGNPKLKLAPVLKFSNIDGGGLSEPLTGLVKAITGEGLEAASEMELLKGLSPYLVEGSIDQIASWGGKSLQALGISQILLSKAIHSNSWESLKGFLSYNLPKESAERIFLTVQLSSMVGFYQRGVWQSDSSDGETARILLKEACRQQLHQTLSMIEDGNLQSGELEPLVLSSYATTLDLLEKIGLREEEICEARKALTKEPVPHSLEADAEKTAKEASKLKGYTPKPQAPIKVKKTPLLFFSKEELQDPGALFVHLKALREFLKTSSDKRTTVHMIDDLVSKLPFPPASIGPDGFWSNVAEPKAVAKELSSLLKIYQKASHSIPPVPELHNTAWSLLAMVHKVSCLLDDAAGLKMLPERPVYYIGNALDKNPFNVFLNKEGANRRQLIEDYFYHHKKAAQFPKGPAYFDYSMPLSVSKKNPAASLKQNPDLSLYDKIFQANPALKNEILSFLDTHFGKDMVNWPAIPKEIRAHLYLHLSFGEDIEKLLEKHGLSYLVHLKRAAVLASMVLPHTMKVYDELKPFKVQETNTGWTIESNLVSDPNDFPLSTGPTLFLFSENSLLNTADWVEDKENLTLKEFNGAVQKMEGVREAILQKYGIKQGGKSFLTPDAAKKLATAHAQPEIQPHHVISYFNDHIPSLYHRETQASFEGLFFKTPVMVGDDEHRTYSQPVVDALKDPGFIKQCVSFIRYGVDHYLVHSKSMPLYNRIRGASFFVRLGCHLQRLRPESKELSELLTSFNKVTDAFVEDPSIQLNDKVLLHYDRIYRYLGTPFDKLKKDEIATIFGSWFFVNAYSNQYVLPYVKHDAQTFVLQLLEYLMANPGKKPDICKMVNSIVHHLPSYNQLPENEEWDSKGYPHLTNGGYLIDLATGRVDGPGIKKGKLIHNTSFTSTSLYKHVFEQQLANYQTHTFYESRTKECNFIDSIYNGMVAKLISKDAQNEWDSGIEFNQKFHGSPDGAWELFRVVEGRRERFVLPNLVEEILPGSLIAGYHHWVAEEGDPKDRKIIVTDPKTGKEVAFLDKSGFIHRVNEGGQGSTLISNLAKEAGKGAFFSKFEREKFIHFEYSDAKVPKLQKVVLDRYTSVHDKSKLEFLAYADGTMRWQSNEQYALATPGSAVQLTSFTNFLHLVHQGDPKKQKILVPIQDFDPATTKPMSTEGALDVKDHVLSEAQKWKANPIKQWNNSHAGMYRFVEFDLVNGGLKPKSQEARVLLAALQLQQKNYIQAAKLLRSINAFEDLSENSQSILSKLLSSDKVMKDRTHDCTAIRYLAIFLLLRYYQRTSKDKHLVDIEIDEKNLITYQTIAPKINSSVRLTGKELELIAEAVGSKVSAASPAQSKGTTGQVAAGAEDSAGDKKGKLALAQMGIYQESIGELYEQYFSATKPLLQDEELPDFDPQVDGLLQKGEMIYSAALTKQIEDFKEEYKTGKVQLEESLFHVLKGGDQKEALQNLLTELGQKHSKLSKIEAGLSKKLLKLANQSANQSEALVKGIKTHGGVEKLVSMEELLYLFIQADRSLYRLANPALTDQEIEKLYQATAEFLQIRIQRQQIQRSRDLTAQAVKIGADMEGHANKIKEFELVVDQLGAELRKKQLYKVQEFPLFSLFEAMSNLKLRPIQVELLKKLFSKNEAGKYSHTALQLIMGGGKTSVLAALQLAESCVEGRIPLFLTPRMQFETVKPSLGESLKNLSIELIPLDFKREDLDISMLTYIRDTLVKTKEHQPKNRRQAIMMTPDALQTLELELHSLVFSHEKGTGSLGISKGAAEKVTLLQQILKDFRTCCDAIGDEVHLLEDENKEINFPSGEKIHVSPERIDLVKHIFAIFSSKEENVEVAGKVCSFDELLDLTNKTRTEIQSNLYQEVIAPKLASLLAEHHIPLALSKNPKHWSAFVRYATGLMNIRVEEYLDGKISKDKLTKQEIEEDVPFLLYTRKDLFGSDDPALQEAAHQIALSKHLITTVLPLTLNNFSGQNFGRTFDSSVPGKVIPFLAVGTPATTEFGYHWETACYQMMEGLCGGCEQAQVLHFANTLKNAGQFDAKVRNVAFSDTVFYQYFKMLTGRELGDLECPNPQPGDLNPYDMKVVEEIMGTISKSPLVRLEIEAFTAGEHLHFFPDRLMSTSQSLFRQVNTFRASSGTPTNHLCYPIDLQEGLLLDKGTEGRIVHNMRLKAKGKSLVHTTNTQDPEAVLSGILSGHKEKERIGGFQDFSGMFKGKDNLEIASGFMRAIKKCGNPQTAVAFFYKPPGYPTPDFMAVVTADHPDEPVILEGTKPSDFEKLNLSPKDIFVYYDERHTQGTDVKQLSTAINIQTKGESGNLPDDLQSAMRLREYLNPDSQDVEYLIHENAKGIFEPIFGKFPPTVDQLLTWELRNLAIAKARGCLKAYKAMLDDILYQVGTEKVLNCDVKNQAEMNVILKVFGPFIRREQGDDPFAQFGRLDQTVTTLDHLQDYSERIKARFLKLAGELLPKDKALSFEVSFNEASDKILAHAKKNQFLQSTVSQPYGGKAESNAFGMQVQQQVQVQQEQQVKVTVKVEQELMIEQEYKMMNQIKGPLTPREEVVWTPDEANAFLKAIQETGASSKNYALPGTKQKVTQMKEIMGDQKIFKYDKPYFKAIPETVFATWNFLMPYKDMVLPVFNNLHRLMSQVLNVKTNDGNWCQVLVTGFEAKQWKKMIEEGTVQNVWLTQSNLSSLANAKEELKEEDALISGMLPIALLAGDIGFLAKHLELAKEWLNEKDPSGDQTASAELYKLKRRLAHLAVHRSKDKLQILQNTPLFGSSNLADAMKKLNIDVLKKQINLGTNKDAIKVGEQQASSASPISLPIDSVQSASEEIPFTPKAPVSEVNPVGLKPSAVTLPPAKEVAKPTSSEPIKVQEVEKPSLPTPPPVKLDAPLSFWEKVYKGFMDFLWAVWQVISWPFRKLIELASA